MTLVEQRKGTTQYTNGAQSAVMSVVVAGTMPLQQSKLTLPVLGQHSPSSPAAAQAGYLAQEVPGLVCYSDTPRKEAGSKSNLLVLLGVGLPEDFPWRSYPRE